MRSTGKTTVILCVDHCAPTTPDRQHCQLMELESSNILLQTETMVSALAAVRYSTVLYRDLRFCAYCTARSAMLTLSVKSTKAEKRKSVALSQNLLRENTILSLAASPIFRST